MAAVTIEVPDELSELMERAGDRLPELLARGLKEPTTLLEREAGGEITPAEKAEPDEYERVEHLMVLIKSGAIQHLTGVRAA